DLSSWNSCVVATPFAFHTIQVSTVVAAHCTSPLAIARWRLACGIFLIVTSRPFLAKIPASLASVSGAKPVQPEMATETLVCALAGAASAAAPMTAATVNSDFMDCSPLPLWDCGNASMLSELSQIGVMRRTRRSHGVQTLLITTPSHGAIAAMTPSNSVQTGELVALRPGQAHADGLASVPVRPERPPSSLRETSAGLGNVVPFARRGTQEDERTATELMLPADE